LAVLMSEMTLVTATGVSRARNSQHATVLPTAFVRRRELSAHPHCVLKGYLWMQRIWCRYGDGQFLAWLTWPPRAGCSRRRELKQAGGRTDNTRFGALRVPVPSSMRCVAFRIFRPTNLLKGACPIMALPQLLQLIIALWHSAQRLPSMLPSEPLWPRTMGTLHCRSRNQCDASPWSCLDPHV
jgi:hypothetical protein